MVVVRAPKDLHPTFSVYLWGSALSGFVKRKIPLPVGYVYDSKAGLINTEQPFLQEDHRKLEEIMNK